MRGGSPDEVQHWSAGKEETQGYFLLWLCSLLDAVPLLTFPEKREQWKWVTDTSDALPEPEPYALHWTLPVR